ERRQPGQVVTLLLVGRTALHGSHAQAAPLLPDGHAQAFTGPAHHPIADVWLPALTVGHRLEKGAQILIAGVAQGRPRRRGRIVHGSVLAGRCRIAHPSWHGPPGTDLSGPDRG